MLKKVAVAVTLAAVALGLCAPSASASQRYYGGLFTSQYDAQLECLMGNMEGLWERECDVVEHPGHAGWWDLWVYA